LYELQRLIATAGEVYLISVSPQQRRKMYRIFLPDSLTTPWDGLSTRLPYIHTVADFGEIAMHFFGKSAASRDTAVKTK